MEKEIKVSDMLGEMDWGKKKVFRNGRIIFKVEEFSVEADIKFERLDPEKILPFEEYEVDKETNTRVKAKKIGFVNGDKQYFVAIQDAKGKWISDTDKPVPAERVEKVIMDKRTGEVSRKDTEKGMKFLKVVPAASMNDWHFEDTYNIWTEENSDNMLKVYEYLVENEMVGVYKFNPYGTAYNAFLIPQRVDNTRFRLLLRVARVKINKPEISPTMSIVQAEAQKREKARTERIGVKSAIEEV